MPNVLIEPDGAIAWVVMNRPEKRNAMNPAMNEDMIAVLDTLEADDAVQVVVLTGAGEAFSAGMDLKEYFHEVDSAPPARLAKVRRDAFAWQYERLRMFPKPTIAMVNGWCFGGAFTPLISCDLAIAADEATFGLSEVNWGIIPAGVVTRDLAAVLGYRTALNLIMTGRSFDGHEAADIGLVNSSVPMARLRDEVRTLAVDLTGKNPATLRAAKESFKMSHDMPWEQARDYLYAKLDQMRLHDTENGRQRGLEQFLGKQFRPGLGAYARETIIEPPA